MTSLKEQYESAMIDAKIEFTQKALDDMLERPISLADFINFVTTSQIQGIAEHLEIGGPIGVSKKMVSRTKRVRIAGDDADEVKLYIIGLFDDGVELSLPQVTELVVQKYIKCDFSRTQRFVYALVSEGVLDRKQSILDARKNVFFAK